MTNANGAPQIGSGGNSLWYGDPGVPAFTNDSTWAISDGAQTNYLGAEFFATTPEPGELVLLAAMLGLLCIGLISRQRKATSQR